MAVWALAHYNAAPGGVVKVLWGLVEYIKKTPTAVPVPIGLASPLPTNSLRPSSSQQEAGAGARKDAGRIEVIAHGYSAATYSTRQAEHRKQRRLRELTELESGKSLDSLPVGTFGFVLHTSFLIGGSDLVSRLPRMVVRRFPSGDEPSQPPFEVQAIADIGAALLGFATETAAAALVSDQAKSVALSPRPSGDLSTLVSISISKLSNMEWRLIQAGTKKGYLIMDVVVR